ncbi:hypothetical protein GLYMA_10G229200v4 [Glycine max]|nr:hypothetical protein GLYMA_10G229200v4 [Glycine max]KAH1139666.1 hypothetical protein GYH30_028848 [Glycine max]
METSQPLSIESFSYSWLVNLRPSALESLESSLRTPLDASDETSSFIEMDPRMPPSKRFFKNSQDSKFDFPISQSPLTLVHADELFSNGYLMPLFVESLQMEEYESSDSNTSLVSSSSHAPKSEAPTGPSRCLSLKKCRTLSRRVFQKYLNFLRPLCRKLRVHKPSIDAVAKRGEAVKNRRYYSDTATSPRISVAFSADDWRYSCDSESSIYEAVLHCKRSIGKCKFNMFITVEHRFSHHRIL